MEKAEMWYEGVVPMCRHVCASQSFDAYELQ